MSRRKSIRTVKELVDDFNPDPNESNGGRLARFLDRAAEELPKTFISRRYCAKIAFMQSRTPGAESDWVKRKLSGVMGGVRVIMERDFSRAIFTDRLDGIRATVDDEDHTETADRVKINRIISSIGSYQRSNRLIDIRNVKGELRKELTRSRRNLKHLESYVENVPKLPPARGKNED